MMSGACDRQVQEDQAALEQTGTMAVGQRHSTLVIS
jgi:hypothetical protein